MAVRTILTCDVCREVIPTPASDETYVRIDMSVGLNHSSSRILLDAHMECVNKTILDGLASDIAKAARTLVEQQKGEGS